VPEYRLTSVALADRTAQVTIRWPRPAGSVDEDLLADLEHLLDWIEDEAACDVVVLRLAPDPALATATELAAPRPELEHCRRWEKLVVRLDRLACISVAVVDGPCVRFWMQLALACDHRVATTRSTFQVLELKEGYLPGMNIFRLAKYVGIGVARRLVFTGEQVTADRGSSLGIVDEICAAEALEAAVAAFLGRLAPVHPVVAQLARRLLSESFATAFEQFVGQYLASQHRCLALGSDPSGRER
jgi:enoyl-CoA hydratase/carnithine racemase